MADARKTQILDALLASLATVTTTNGYSRTVKSVHRSATGIPAMANMDAVCILSADVRKDHLVSCTVATMTVTLLAMVEERRELEAAIDAIEADIEKALGVDPSLGGLAIDTKVMAAREAVSEELEGLGGTVLEIEIKYRHRVGDPYTA